VVVMVCVCVRVCVCVCVCVCVGGWVWVQHFACLAKVAIHFFEKPMRELYIGRFLETISTV
jgi:hypothetical protein